MEEQQATVNGINGNIAELTRIGPSTANRGRGKSLRRDRPVR